MHDISALIGIATALAIGAVSPGPSFVMVARTAASSNRVNGISAAVGMGLGGFIFALLSLIGLVDLLVAVPTLYLVLKIAGGLYLAYLGIRIWNGANDSLSVSENTWPARGNNVLRYFGLGLATQLSNPKTAIVYASVFAAFLPKLPSMEFKASVVVIVFMIEAIWYSVVAVMLSGETSRKKYLHFKSLIDRVAGGIMLALGLKLVVSSSK